MTSSHAAAYGCMHAPCFLRRAARTPRRVFQFQLDAQCRNFNGGVYHDITTTLPDVLEVLAEIDHIYAASWGGTPVKATVECLVTQRRFDLTTHGAQKYALATTRGAECGVMYAECFHALRPALAAQLLEL
jgi:hypothetical protein